MRHPWAAFLLHVILLVTRSVGHSPAQAVAAPPAGTAAGGAAAGRASAWSPGTGRLRAAAGAAASVPPPPAAASAAHPPPGPRTEHQIQGMLLSSHKTTNLTRSLNILQSIRLSCITKSRIPMTLTEILFCLQVKYLTLSLLWSWIQYKGVYKSTDFTGITTSLFLNRKTISPTKSIYSYCSFHPMSNLFSPVTFHQQTTV